LFNPNFKDDGTGDAEADVQRYFNEKFPPWQDVMLALPPTGEKLIKTP